MKRLVLATVLIVFTVVSVSAKTYYVSPSGSSTSTGTHPDSSWTIAKSFSTAAAGDTVWIKGGNYGQQYLKLTNNGTSTKPIVFEGYDGRPELDGIDCTYNKMGIYLSGKSYVTIRNIRVKNYYAGIWLEACTYCTLDGCVADSAYNGQDPTETWDGYGLIVRNGSHNTLKNCSSTDCQGNNITIMRADYCTIENCQSYCKQTTYNNYITDYHILVDWSSHCVVRDSYAEDLYGSPKGNHGFMVKDSSGDQGSVTQHSTDNLFVNCVAKRFEEPFVFAFGAYGNTFDSCFADNTGKDWEIDACFVARDGAHHNLFKNCRGIAHTGGVFLEERLTTTNYQRNNTFINCLIEGGEVGILEQNTIETLFLNCTFVNQEYLFRFEKGRSSGLDSSRATTFKNCIISGVNNPYDTETRTTTGWTQTQYDDMGDVSATYTDFWDNGFSGLTGAGNMTRDPLFASATDFHLKSKGGRWNGSGWVLDNLTSPCIDAGDSTSDYSDEPMPNGGRVDMGRYGNAKDASLSGLQNVLYVSMDSTLGSDYLCDGASDDVEINAALAHADTSEQYDTVFLVGPAVYTITDTLLIGGGTTLTGDSTVVVRVGAGSSQGAALAVRAYRQNGVTIRGFGIDGNRANNTTSCALCVMDSVTGLEISGMTLSDATYDLIEARGCDSVSVHDNILSGSGNDGVLAYRSRNVRLYNNRVAARGGTGLKASCSDTVKIYGNTVYGTAEAETAGIRIQRSGSSASWPVKSVEVYENTVYDTDRTGIEMYSATPDPGDSVHVHHNTVYNCGTSGGAYTGISCYAFTLLCENNVVDSCASGAFAVPAGTDAAGGFTLRLRNNIFSNSPADTAVVCHRTGTETLTLEYNCLFNTLSGYSGVTGGTAGNITGDPLFANPAEHDYRLKSLGGRWNGVKWAIDTVTSPCVDAGDPASDYADEPAPNGGRINIGRHGNTAEASKTQGAGPVVFVSAAPDSTGDFVCDGTNDEVQINAAIAFVDTSVQYNTVYLKGAATYAVDNPILLCDDLILTGDSSAVVRVINSANWDSGVNVIGTRSTTPFDIVVRGFEIDGNRANNSSAAYALCRLDSATNVEICGMTMHDGPADLVSVRFGTDISIHGNTLSGAGNDAILAYCDRNVGIFGNTVAARTGSGINASASDTVKIYGNTVYGTGDAETAGIQVQRPSGMGAWPVQSVEVYENTVYNTDQYGISLFSGVPATTDSVHIHHNTIYNCGQTAAYAGVSSCTFQLLFENNVVDSCAFGAFSMPKGIDTKSGFVLRLRNNIFSNSPADTAVIHRRTSTQKLYLENNCFFNNLLDYNTATSVSGNITGDPLFADPAAHDYHLKSLYGRWTAAGWVTDAECSPCIDAGSLDADYSNEPEPDGGRINIGRYGNTAEASKSNDDAVETVTPAVFALSQNVPNPFNPSTAISYSIPAQGLVTLTIYNITGQKVETLVNKTLPAGRYTVIWNPQNLASGIYFCRLSTARFSASRKLIFVK